MEAIITQSTRKNKRFMTTIYDHQKRKIKVIHFGSPNPTYGTFLDHQDEQRRQAYIKRHQSNEDWTDEGIHTSGFWSRWFLWSKPTINQALRETEKQAKNKLKSVSFQDKE